MKIRISIIVSLMLCALSSCTSSSDDLKSFAEQYMEAFSRGDTSSLNGSNNALVIDEIVRASLDSVSSPDNVVDKYFQIGEPFIKWELLDITEEDVDLYDLRDLTVGDSGVGGKNEGAMYKAYLDLYKKEGGEVNNTKLIKINERMAIILEKGVPLYHLRYKIDEHHKAYVGNIHRTVTLGVIKHPEHGYKIVSFMWED